MKRLILYSYNFPPIGGAGAQRPVKFARYLGDLGWDAVVLTGPGAAHGRWTPEDASLAADLPAELQIERVPGPEPARSGGWNARAERWLRARSPWEHWWTTGSVEQARRIRDAAAIWTIMSPYESAASSLQIAMASGRPWIADLGDPWALDEMMIYPSALHRRLELGRMRRSLGTAAAIVMSTPEAAERVKHAFPELARKPIVVIPNGFDTADFAGAAPNRADEAFRIVHTGYLHTELGRQQQRVSTFRSLTGGGVRGVEIITRSHVYLLDAVNRLLADDPAARSRLEVHFAGVMSDADAEIADACPASRRHGYVTHAESLELIRSADLLFLPMQNLPTGMRAGIVPGKTYEYLASGRPILGALPEGDAQDILRRAGAAFICRPDDVAAMQTFVGDLVNGRVAASPRNPEVVAEFTYENLCERVVELLEQIAS